MCRPATFAHVGQRGAGASKLDRRFAGKQKNTEGENGVTWQLKAKAMSGLRNSQVLMQFERPNVAVENTTQEIEGVFSRMIMSPEMKIVDSGLIVKAGIFWD